MRVKLRAHFPLCFKKKNKQTFLDRSNSFPFRLDMSSFLNIPFMLISGECLAPRRKAEVGGQIDQEQQQFAPEQSNNIRCSLLQYRGVLRLDLA